ncbi:hypothetical protein [Flintibacter muris]|uniref:hypothetical protein n=1 Tax=Flintibacter muris TaxID=2941327 RepID=UPI00203E3B2F|nr:hypothetical protein [Flintibacter muris]
MDQYMEMLTHMLKNQPAKIEVTFPNLSFRADEIVSTAAFQALLQIQKILQDNSLSDRECFYKIEAIVYELERIGLSCGSRHDFG